ncbi:MAG: ComF family protein [Gammaproteobacteria bacterium]|nr:MAG: ComF family protein [Gammaproteobacteria bacterium]
MCGPCLQCPPPFDRVRAPLAWRRPVDRLVHALKFHERLELAAPLAALWRPGPLPDALVPVPLHPARLRERGYNQAALLARAAGRRWGVPVLEPCIRTRPTPPQHRLDAAARRRNLDGAFACAPLPAGCRRLALVDDVMTTGTTLRVLARALRAQGAAYIEAWVVARV